jgi:hypothetical protein
MEVWMYISFTRIGNCKKRHFGVETRDIKSYKLEQQNEGIVLGGRGGGI